MAWPELEQHIALIVAGQVELVEVGSGVQQCTLNSSRCPRRQPATPRGWWQVLGRVYWLMRLVDGSQQGVVEQGWGPAGSLVAAQELELVQVDPRVEYHLTLKYELKNIFTTFFKLENNVSYCIKEQLSFSSDNTLHTFMFNKT